MPVFLPGVQEFAGLGPISLPATSVWDDGFAMNQSTKLPIYNPLCLILLLASGLMTSGLVSGCASFPLPVPSPTPTVLPSPTVLPTPSPWPTPTPEPLDTGWQPLGPGIEFRQIRVEVSLPSTPSATPTTSPAETRAAERLTIVRLDPARVYFRVHYDQQTPRHISTWATHLQQPTLITNGGYFTPENQTTGLLISDGQTWGSVYGDFAGLFAVTADEQVSVRWLRDQPYDPTESLTQAVMSFPVLVKPGGVMGFPADADAGTPARRTVVAQDNQGQILFIAAPRGTLSLHQMAVFLTESDLEIDVALNLDGGFSTGLWLEAGDASTRVDSHVPVPSIISVEARDGL